MAERFFKKVGNSSPEEITREELASFATSNDTSTRFFVKSDTAASEEVRPSDYIPKLADTELSGRRVTAKNAMSVDVPTAIRRRAIAKNFAAPEMDSAKVQYAKDLAEFNKQQRESWVPMNFESWLEDKYGAKTGKGKSNPIVTAGRILNDIIEGRPKELGGMNAPDIPVIGRGGMNKVLSSARKAWSGTTPEAANFARYAAITAPKEASPTIGEMGQAIWENKAELPGMMVDAMLDPHELATNVAGMALGAGIGSAAAKAARLGKSASALQRIASAGKGVPAGMAADAALSGTTGAFQSGEFNPADFAMSAAPGVVLGGLGAAAGAGRELLHRVPAERVPLRTKIAAERKSAALLGNTAPSQEPISAGEVISSMGLRQKDGSSVATLSKAEREGMLDAVQDPEIRRLIPNLTDADLGDPDLVYKALVGRERADARAAAPAPEQVIPSKVEAMRQHLPMDPANEGDFFTSGTAKQQDDKLIKAARAYQELRKYDAVPENPRFEGKSAADLIAERIRQAQEDEAKIKATKAEGEQAQLLKDQAVEEQNLRMQGLQRELDFTKNVDAISGRLEFARAIEDMGQPGALRNEFASLSPEHQRLLLQNVDAMGDAGEAVKRGLGPIFEPLRKQATNTSLSDQEFGKLSKMGLEADAKRTEAMQQAVPQEAAQQPTQEPPSIAVEPEPTDGAAEARAAHVATLERNYAAGDEAKRADILRYELETNPAAGEAVGITEQLLQDAKSSNKSIASGAKKEIDAKLLDAAKSPELPESFR